MPDIGFVCLAFALGLLLSRATLCAVACVRESVVERRASGVLRLATVAATAGVVLLGAAAAAPGHVALPTDAPPTLLAVYGGALLGLGAVVNGACYLGTLGYLARGDSGFLFTFVGIVAGLWLQPAVWPTITTGATRFDGAAGPLLGAAAFVLVLGGVFALAARLGRERSPHGAQAALLASLGVCVGAGALAGTIYAGNPSWNYATLLGAFVHGTRGNAMPWTADIAALALVAGATLGAVLAGGWHFRGPTPYRIVRGVAGGALMATGAALIPGGHDLLLLWAVPGLSPGGTLAYAVMAAVVAVLLHAGDRAARRGAARA